MKPGTIGEINIMFQNLNGRFDDLLHKVEENTKITELVLTQATKTNGRVNIIEPLALDYQEKRARLRGAAWVIALVGVSCLTVGGFALNSYLNYKTEQITNGVIQKLETKYNIEYEESNTKTIKEDKANIKTN